MNLYIFLAIDKVKKFFCINIIKKLIIIEISIISATVQFKYPSKKQFKTAYSMKGRCLGSGAYGKAYEGTQVQT